MSRKHHKQEQGFTLVELSLSMAFIAMLLLGIALLTIQISAIYNKGLTMRSVNESGRLIAKDMQQTLNAAVATKVAFVDDDAGGRLCANNVVYAWNYAGRINSNGFSSNQNIYDSGEAGIRLIRFAGGVGYCNASLGSYPAIPSGVDGLTELLKEGDNTLALHEVTLSENSVAGDESRQKIYAISFILGSNDIERLAADGCRIPQSKVDDTYCVVNQFRFTARAGNMEPSEGYGG